MIFSLLRTNNWIKNLLVFVPVVFSYNLTDIELLFNETLAFLGFCFAASAIYILNDIIDRKKDALHPRKKLRPITSGAIKPIHAIIVAVLLLIMVGIISFQLNLYYGISILGYVLLNFAYSLFLKQINLVEILIVSVFFILRVVAGCMAIGVEPTQWIIMVTFFIAVFLTAIKRKSELILVKENARKHRRVLNYYSIELLDVIVYITGTTTILGYVLYTMDPRTINTFDNSGLIYSSFFVVLGLFRFIQLSKNNSYKSEGDPTFLILKDRFLQITIILWSASVVLILYIL